MRMRQALQACMHASGAALGACRRLDLLSAASSPLSLPQRTPRQAPCGPPPPNAPQVVERHRFERQDAPRAQQQHAVQEHPIDQRRRRRHGAVAARRRAPHLHVSIEDRHPSAAEAVAAEEPGAHHQLGSGGKQDLGGLVVFELLLACCARFAAWRGGCTQQRWKDPTKQHTRPQTHLLNLRID